MFAVGAAGSPGRRRKRRRRPAPDEGRDGVGVRAAVPRRSGVARSHPRRPRRHAPRRRRGPRPTRPSASSAASAVSSAASAVRGRSASRSTTLPDASVIVVCSSSWASALVRRTSATNSAMLPPCCSCWAYCSGLTRLRWACGDDLRGEVVVVDGDLAGVGDRVEDELGLDGLLDRPALLGVVGLAALRAGDLQVGVPVHAGLAAAPAPWPGCATRPRARPGSPAAAPRRVSSRCSTSLSRAWAPCWMRLGALQPGADVVAQLGEGVELAGRRGELVVELGQLLGLDRADGDGHLGLLAGVRAGAQRGGEGRRLVGGQPADGVVEALHEVAGADLVGHAGGRCRPRAPRRRPAPPGRWRRSRRPGPGGRRRSAWRSARA